jgi:DNA mismatch repair ATPase MutL
VEEKFTRKHAGKRREERRKIKRSNSRRRRREHIHGTTVMTKELDIDKFYSKKLKIFLKYP